MRRQLITAVLGLAVLGVTVVPSRADQDAAIATSEHHQQLGRAKKALENALVAIQASGNWAGGEKKAAMNGVETAITETDKEMNAVDKKPPMKKK